MSELTRQAVLTRKRDRYARAGKEHKTKILDEVVELFGYHRKAAIRALQPRSAVVAPYVRGRPKDYDPEKLLPPLKAIWLAALQPCGERLKACLPDWLPAYEADHRRLDADVRQSLLAASRATLDRLLIPARVAHRRRAATRPGGLLRAEIPIRTEWPENAPGFLEMDTVALCGGALDDRHGWMFDAVDVHTTWSVRRGLPNRSEASVCGQMDDLAGGLPFALRGLDSDNGGEFINHQLVRYCAGRTPPVAFTRARPYRKNDQAHIEQKNFTNVRLWCGYECYDHAEVWPLINVLCRGALDQRLNYFLPTMKLAKKERVGSQTVRHYEAHWILPTGGFHRTAAQQLALLLRGAVIQSLAMGFQVARFPLDRRASRPFDALAQLFQFRDHSATGLGSEFVQHRLDPRVGRLRRVRMQRVGHAPEMLTVVAEVDALARAGETATGQGKRI